MAEAARLKRRRKQRTSDRRTAKDELHGIHRSLCLHPRRSPQARRRPRRRGRGRPGAVRIAEISDFEVERLGDLAGTAVHASGADYELAMVDVASDSLLGVPPAMVRALAELLSYETEGEGDVLDDVAESWAAEEDMPFGAGAGRPLRPAARRTGRRRRPRQQVRPLRLDVLTGPEAATGPEMDRLRVSSRNPAADLAQ